MRFLEPLRRIRWQLPLSIAALLLAVVVAYTWMAHREVRRAALEATGDRLTEVAGQLGALLDRPVTNRRDETLRLARDSALADSLRLEAPVPATVRARFDSLLASGAQVGSVRLWDSAGGVRFEVRRAEDDSIGLGREFPTWASADSASVSPFFADGEVVWYEVAAPVRSEDRTLGFVVQSRQLAGSSPGAQILADLIGRDATFLVGTPGGVWTDFAVVVEGPPVGTSAAEGPALYKVLGRGDRLGSGLSVAGTPWELWVELPSEGVLSRATAFLTRMVPLGAFIVLLGIAAGWALSRRVTGGLGSLTTAATAMADGSYERRVPTGRRDELGELATAFNEMATQVEDARHRLELRVQERTADLAASREQFSAIADTAHEAIVTADAEGRITYFNPGAERIFGHAHAEVLGEPLTVLMPEEYRDAHRLGFARHLETGISNVLGHTLALKGLRRDGSEFPVELSLASWSRNGRPAFAGIIRDVTARREAEEALERSAAELRSVNEELEAFSYSVSHDLRAPLRSIHGFSQALMEDYRERLDAQGVDYLTRVCTAVDRMGHLIDDLLQLARAARATLRWDTVDLAGLSRDILEGLQGAEPDRTVDVEIPDELPANGDPHLLRQALENLLGNAWKFTAKSPQAHIEVTIQDGEDGPVFVVRDNGAGFDMAYADKLFGPFQRLHSPSDFPGTGVGLALVQRIIHRHGGRIWADGAVDEGASFYFTLSEP